MKKGTYKHLPETLQKMSEAQKRIGNHPPSNKGGHLTEEHKKKISESLKNRPNGMEGKKHSEETKRKISEKAKGRKASNETKTKMREKGLKRHHSEITKRKISESRIGIKNWNWLGGVSFEPYGLDWTKTLRRAIRERDHYRCQLCGKPQEDKAHHVHHIDYDKKHNDPENLITLCSSCHLKTNYNRNYWFKYFKN